MTEDWLALCRAAAEDVRGVLRELPTRIEREPVVGDGVGGDETTAVDAAAERVILERLRAIDGATIVSEEVGELAGDGRLRRTTSSSVTCTTSAPARSGRPSAVPARG